MYAVTPHEVKSHVNRRPKCQVHFLTVSAVWQWLDNGIRDSITIKVSVMKTKTPMHVHIGVCVHTVMYLYLSR